MHRKESSHERVILGKSVFQEKNSRFINKIKKKTITVPDFTKKSRENISKVLIQEGSVTIKVLEKYTFFLL